MKRSRAALHGFERAVAVTSVLVAGCCLWDGASELFGRGAPELPATLASAFVSNGEEGPLGALLVRASSLLVSRRAAYVLVVLIATATALVSAFELARAVGQGRSAALTAVLAAFLAIGWADWRVLTSQWHALLAGGLVTLALALQVRAAAAAGARGGWLSAACGALFGIALLTRHAIWPALLPSFVWFLRARGLRHGAGWAFLLAVLTPLAVAGLTAALSGALAPYVNWLVAWDWVFVPLSSRPLAQLLSDGGLLILLWLVPAMGVLAGARAHHTEAQPAAEARFAEFTLAAWVVSFWPLTPFPSGGLLTSLLVLAPAFGCLLAVGWTRALSRQRFSSETWGDRLGASGWGFVATLFVALLLVGRASALDFDAHRSPIERQADLFE